jgi:hypothetical protein
VGINQEPYELLKFMYGSKGRSLGLLPNRGEQAAEQEDFETSEAWFNQAAEYWKQAIALAPNNYIEAQNWLQNTGRW